MGHSKTNVTGREKAKPKGHIGNCGHKVIRAYVKGIKGSGKFQWYCEECKCHT